MHFSGLSHYRGYRCLDLTTNKIIIYRHITSIESTFPFSRIFPPSSTATHASSPSDEIFPPLPLDVTRPLNTPPGFPPIPFFPPYIASFPLVPSESPTSPLDNNSHSLVHCPSSFDGSPSSWSPLQIAHSSPATRPTGHIYPITTRSQTGSFKPRSFMNLSVAAPSSSSPTLSSIPASYRQALCYHNWTSAMDDELSVLLSNDTWDLVPHLSDVNVVGPKWIFRRKFKSDGSLERYKARIIAQGFTQ